MLINSIQMSCDSCEAALDSDWLFFFSSKVRTKIMLRKEEKGKPKKVKMRAEVHAQPQEPSAPMDPPVSNVEAPPPLSEMERVAEVEMLGEVTGVIADLTVGSDGCRGQAIYIGW